MSRSPDLSTLAVSLLAALVLVAVLVISPDSVLAEPSRQLHTGIGIEAPLDEADELAALEAVQLALSEVADGSTYVWYRAHGRLNGAFRPTQSFRDAAGKICRHLKVTLTSGALTRSTEGIACRTEDGRWSLDG